MRKKRHMAVTAFLTMVVLAVFVISPTQADQAGTNPVKIYLMCGQSNMVGHGNWYDTDGITLMPNLTDPDNPYALTQAQVDLYTMPRGDVWVNHPAGKNSPVGPLAPGFGNNDRQIGVELSMGHMLGDTYENQFYFFKSDKGGTTLGVLKARYAGPAGIILKLR